LVSWNILSENCMEFKYSFLQKYYPSVNKESLKWIERKYKILNLLKSENVDIICLQETDIRSYRFLKYHFQKIGYQISKLYIQNPNDLKNKQYGNVVLSKLPILNEQYIAGKEQLIEFENFQVINLHLNDQYDRIRNKEIKNILDGADLKKNTIICGDFNNHRSSKQAEMLKKYQFKTTGKNNSTYMCDLNSIDFIYFTKQNFKIYKYEILFSEPKCKTQNLLDEIGSDHRPIFVKFTCQ